MSNGTQGIELLTNPSFDLQELLNENSESKQIHSVQSEKNGDNYNDFFRVCSQAKAYLEDLTSRQKDEWTTRQKNAMLLIDDDVNYYMEEIKQYLKKSNAGHLKFPPWYDNLVEGIFHENWGLGGIYEWVKRGDSGQCKIVQPNIFFFEDGQMVLKPQRLTAERFEKIKNTLLLNDTSQRKTSNWQEIYLTKDIRIEIFNNHKKSAGQGYIIFRRNVVDKTTLDELAVLNTFDNELIPALTAMVDCGFNMCTIGPVKSGKTTFLKAYQRYENKLLEGVSIETDPEIDFQELMGYEAPFMELIADNEELEQISKALRRSDADYYIFPEARDGRALMLLLKITKMGTRRVKGAFHTATPEDFPYDVAREIVDVFGGDLWGYMIQTAINFDFLFEFRSSPDNPKQKRLMGIYEIQFDRETFEIRSNAICRYEQHNKRWVYNSTLSKETIERAKEVSITGYQDLYTTLQKLEVRSPNTNPYKISPFSRLIPIQGR
ncbi:hypothetical protein ACQKMI_24420 [Lysinibacillus sp. NPDC097214]|uniref:hypothetical protein n=1 Tax=Lysinibacillus sp. NPDC097214 TaxID=3390584 RepID=UPI003D00F792